MLIYKLQSGFMKGQSTVNQLIDIYIIYINHICQGIDCSQYACMICCDVSKDSDRVWLKRLFFKLKQNGLQGSILKWIEIYLT